MLTRSIRNDEQQVYNQVVNHPLQAWEWGKFRSQTGVQVERVGFFNGDKLAKALQVTFHHIPVFNRTAGYLPMGETPDEEQLAALQQLGKQHNAIFIKMEPNVSHPAEEQSAFTEIAKFLKTQDAVPGRPMFNHHTFILDLSPTEDELFANLQSRTRYNVNLAAKKGVKIVEDTSAQGMETFIQIMEATTKHQGFYLHTPEYFRQMWQNIGSSGMMRIFHAHYDNKVLVSWIIFIFNGVIYYSYGSSLREHRDVMASNLMMWEMIRLGKQLGCRHFDMWGAMGPNPDKNDPRIGYHNFKKGYGGVLHEFLGSYDLVIDHRIYPTFRFVENWRWKFLRLKAKLGL